MTPDNVGLYIKSISTLSDNYQRSWLKTGGACHMIFKVERHKNISESIRQHNTEKFRKKHILLNISHFSLRDKIRGFFAK